MTTTLYLVEHGLTPGDGSDGEVVHGWNGDGLTDAGRALVRDVTAPYLKGKHVGEVYSSDLRRAVETANALRDALEIAHPNTERRGLRPMDVGTLAGQPKADVEGVLDDLRARRWAKAPGGESYGKFLGRWGQELDRTIHEAAGEEEYNCVYVTHSHNLGSLAHLLSGGRTPTRLEAPVGAGGVIALRVADDGSVSMRRALAGR